MAGQDEQTPAERLAAAGRAGYDAFPNDCSHSVWYMLKQLGLEQRYMVANALMTHVSGRGSGWRQVNVTEAGRLADEGKMVIGGLASSSGSGHVVMVMPGSRPSGGFPMRNGKPLLTAGMFPRSASGASSSWPGAHSRGEKTVRDPWNNQDWARVTFWTRN